MVLYSAEFRDEAGKQRVTLRVNDGGTDKEIIVTTDSLKKKIYSEVFDSISSQDITAEVQAETNAETAAIASSTTFTDEEKTKLTISLQSVESQKRISATVKNRIASAQATTEANQMMTDYLGRLGNVYATILSDVL